MKYWFDARKVIWMRIVSDRYVVVAFDNCNQAMEINCSDLTDGLETLEIKKKAETLFDEFRKEVNNWYPNAQMFNKKELGGPSDE